MIYGNFQGLSDPEKISMSWILSRVSAEDIYSYYLGERIDISRPYFSPFKTERTPSFRIYRSGGRVFFKCFATGYWGDCFQLVSFLFPSLSKSQILVKICNDLNIIMKVGLTNDLRTVLTTQESVAVEKKNKIEVVIREWSKNDLNLWSKWGINLEDLTRYNIKACDEVWLNDKFLFKYHTSNPIYRYLFNGRYKIYRPCARSKEIKWLSNTVQKDIQGFEYLPQTGKTLVITKSYKDVICVNKIKSLSAIAMQSESASLSEKFVNYLKKRFENIVIFYDNDDPGINFASLRSSETGLPYIYIPRLYGDRVKDMSDLNEKVGVVESNFIVSKLINKTIKNSSNFIIEKISKFN